MGKASITAIPHAPGDLASLILSACANAFGVVPKRPLNPAVRMLRFSPTLRASSSMVLGMAGTIGSIEPGKQADFALVDRDLLAVPDAQVAATKVQWTMFGGKIVYSTK